MHFSFKPLLMVSTLVGSFISGSVQASDTLPFSYKDVDDARQNSTTLTYNDNQYTVEECYGDHCQVTSEDFIPSWMMSGYGNTLTILEDMHDPCPNHTNGNYEVGWVQTTKCAMGRQFFQQH